MRRYTNPYGKVRWEGDPMPEDGRWLAGEEMDEAEIERRLRTVKLYTMQDGAILAMTSVDFDVSELLYLGFASKDMQGNPRHYSLCNGWPVGHPGTEGYGTFAELTMPPGALTPIARKVANEQAAVRWGDHKTAVSSTPFSLGAA